MIDRLKVKLLVVVWGDRYVKDFSQIALPALLAPANLTYLAQETDLEVLIMTQRASVQFFHREPSYKQLTALCPARFIFIDDLIPGENFGVTLTLAYARGIRDSGDEQTNTYFIFMNADFVTADGSLRTLHAKMKEGHNVVFAPSLRACSEPTEPVLLKAVDPASNRLVMPPREMVRLALDNLHPTVIAKTITQRLIRCNEYNHIYWQVDGSTLLARNYLIFIPMIKPERPMLPVNSYSDYGFVPELVPSGRMTVLKDSDEFFMLELQRTAQESHRICCGFPDVAEIATELSRWTTREHRFVAEHDFVFHADELPANLQSLRTQAGAYMAALRAKMAHPPADHVDHPYWISGLQFWLALRSKRQRAVAELAPLPSHPSSRALPGKGKANLVESLRCSYRTTSRIPLWRHHWLDVQLVLDWVEKLGSRRERPSVFLFSAGSLLARPHPELRFFKRLELDSLIEAEAAQQVGTERYANVLCHVSSDHIKHVRSILERISPVFEEDVEIAVYAESWNFTPKSGSLTQELATSVQHFLPGTWLGYEIDATFAGSRSKQWLTRAEIHLLNRIFHPSSARIALLLPNAILLSAVLGLTAVNNWRLRRRIKETADHCSSILVRLRRRAVAAGAN